jgi:hypothetical protein
MAFVLEAGAAAGMKSPAKPQSVALGRAALAAMALDSRGAAAPHDEHDDE